MAYRSGTRARRDLTADDIGSGVVSGRKDCRHMDDLQTDYAANELRYNAFMEPIYRSALTALELPAESAGLDAGCGPGGLLPLLDAATGRKGTLTGIDGSAAHLAAAAQVANAHAIGERVRFQQLDLRKPLPFPDKSFDWAWCADVLWSSLFADPRAVISELGRVVKKGGTIAIFFANVRRGLMLPGEPDLDNRLNCAVGRMWNSSPSPLSHHPEAAAAWLRSAGLMDVGVSVHASVYQQPLPRNARDYLEGYWIPERQRLSESHLRFAGIDQEARDRWNALADPGSPEYLVDQPDYYCIPLATLASGKAVLR